MYCSERQMKITFSSSNVMPIIKFTDFAGCWKLLEGCVSTTGIWQHRHPHSMRPLPGGGRPCGTGSELWPIEVHILLLLSYNNNIMIIICRNRRSYTTSMSTRGLRISEFEIEGHFRRENLASFLVG